MYPPLELIPTGARNTTHASLAGDEKLIDAHKTQLKLPIDNGLVASKETGPPLAELFKTSQTDLSSILREEVVTRIIEEVDAIQLHDVNVHWLELEMVAVEEYMK